MPDQKFLVIDGKFICKTCKQEISSARFWHSTKEVSWICSNKHISTVGLLVKKKKKKDFE